MRAFFAALAQILKGIFGIAMAPFQWVGSLFGGGGSADPQEQAAAVAKRAAAEEMAADMEIVADKPVTLDEVSTVKRVCGRLLAGKAIAAGTRLSPSIMESLANLSKPMLRQLADAAPEQVHDYIDGYRAGYFVEEAKVSGRTPEQLRAAFPKLAARIAARQGTPEGDEIAAAWGMRQPA